MAVVIGLTGSIAAGKSSIANELQKLGAAVLDCDKVVADLYKNELLTFFKQEFPETIENGKISNTLIKQHIMKRADKKLKLESAVHPLVHQRVAEFVATNNGLVVLEIQLLFESKAFKQPEYAIDYIVVVTAPYEQRFKRSRKTRPHITKLDFDHLNSLQMAEEEKAAKADFVIDNTDGINLSEQIENIVCSAKFYKSWRELAARLKFPKNKSEAFLQKLYFAYSGKSRHYHGITHITYLLELATKFRSKIRDYDAFVLAIFLHDFIYEISREKSDKTNEEKSADATSELADLGFPPKKIQKVQQFILASQKHQDSGNEEINLFLDMDLFILASTPELYDLYSDSTRNEYLTVYTPAEYAHGRAKFLKEMIKRDSVFLTEDFRKHDKQSKENLKRELIIYEKTTDGGSLRGKL